MNFFSITWNEIKKELLTTLSYKFQWLGELLSLTIFYFFLSKIANTLEFSTFSYCFWFYSMLIIGDISGKISLEMKLGTFEQVYLATYPISTILLAKTFTSILRSGFLMMFLILFLFSSYDFNFSGFMNLNVYLSILFIIPGLFGISLLIGGITLLLKDAGWILNIINNCMLFLNGTLISLNILPYWLQKIATLIPTTQVIQFTKQDNIFLVDWLTLLFTNLIYLTIGGLVFFFCNKKAKSKGILAHY